MQEAFVADASTHFQELGGVVKAGVAHEVLVRLSPRAERVYLGER